MNNLELLFGYDTTGIKTKFLKTVVRSILNECLDQLYILRIVNVHNDVYFNEEPLEYMSIRDRYMGVEDHAEIRINSCSSNYEKLANDINILINILRDGIEELHFGGTCTTMRMSIEAIRQMEDDDKELLEEKKENDKKIELLRNQCEEERLYNIRTIEETNAKIQKLRFEVEDVIVYGRYEMAYFGNWEKARQEQNKMACEEKENVHNFIIKDMMNKIDLENRCHAELENYIQESRNDYTDGIQYWMKQYDEEIEKKEAEMINIRSELEKFTESHAALKETYEKRKAEIADWLEYKRIKKEKEDRMNLEIWAATKLQAWWRGVMFRKKLGPYRKKKKGKAKDKKKGAKK